MSRSVGRSYGRDSSSPLEKMMGGRSIRDGRKKLENRYRRPIRYYPSETRYRINADTAQPSKFVTLYSVSKALVDCVHEVESVQGTLRVQILEERRGLGRRGIPRVPLIRA